MVSQFDALLEDFVRIRRQKKAHLSETNAMTPARIKTSFRRGAATMAKVAATTELLKASCAEMERTAAATRIAMQERGRTEAREEFHRLVERANEMAASGQLTSEQASRIDIAIAAAGERMVRL